jgi:hypothetical protein
MTTLSKYPRPQVTIWNYHDRRLAPYWQQLRQLILPLRPFSHFGENGVSPTGIQAWMDYHNFPLAGQEEPIYGTRVAINQETGDVLGMATLVVDDRGVGIAMKAEFGIEATGFWGGVFMFTQGAGIGRHVCEQVDAQIQSRVDRTGSCEQWVLFTANPWAVSIYCDLGFRLVKKRHWIKGFEAHEDVYVKEYVAAK